MSAPKGNSNARKSPDERAEATIVLRLPRELKGEIKRAAMPGKMSHWLLTACREKLDRASR